MNRIKVKADFYAEFKGNFVYPDGTDAKVVTMEENEHEIKNDLIEIVESDNGKKYVSKLKGVEINNIKFLSRIPNPVFVLLNSAIDNLNQSEFYLVNFKNHSQQFTQSIFRLEDSENGTSDVFNSFVQHKIVSINSLINSLEIFINQKIPIDYSYEKEKNNVTIKLNKKEIEHSLSFREKIETLLPLIFSEKKFSVVSIEIHSILDIYSIRRELVHMKTNGKNVFEQYFEIMTKLVDADIKKYIDNTITFMNFIENNFVEFEL